MGSTVGIREPYEYSLSAEEHSNGKQKGSSFQRPVGTKGDYSKLLPVKPTLLAVPCYDGRHPFQDFRFVKRLGEGSFSVVHKAVSLQDVVPHGKVAIKEIDTVPLSKRQLADLTLEVNVLSQLRHENIVELYSVYHSNNRKFLVTEYLKGGQLLSAIGKKIQYTENDARKLMIQIVSALSYLHARKVVHRDIKPENLILANHGEDSSCDSYVVKLVDFGFAALESPDLKASKCLCGSPGYMAPEILRDRSYSTKVDIWALGVVFYILLSGLMPFSIHPEGEEFVLSGKFRFPHAKFSRVSNEAKDLICRMLTVDVDERISAKEILEHPWMKTTATPSNAFASQKMEAAADIGLQSSPQSSKTGCRDVDISENLESIRHHQATVRFQFGAKFFDKLLHGHGSSPKSHAHAHAHSHTVSSQESDAMEFAKTIAYEAKQAEKLHRLHTAMVEEVR